MRSLRIISELLESFHVRLLIGGEWTPKTLDSPYLSIVPLLPLKADREFTSLYSPNGFTLDEAFTARRLQIMQEYESFKPDVVVVELFPFGRGAFKSEIIPLLSAARNSAIKVISSVRDILTPPNNRAGFESSAINHIDKYIDFILVHGDPCFFPFSNSFLRFKEIESKVIYTGYVAPAISERCSGVSHLIVTTLGGGRFGHELAEAVIEAASILHMILPDYHIQLYTGPLCPRTTLMKWKNQADGHPNLTVQHYTADLPSVLAKACLSISLGGYNTVMDSLVVNVPSLIWASRNDKGMDQVLRAQALHAYDFVSALDAADLEPGRMAERIKMEIFRTHKRPHLNLDGAKNTRDIVSGIVDAHV